MSDRPPHPPWWRAVPYYIPPTFNHMTNDTYHRIPCHSDFLGDHRDSEHYHHRRWSRHVDYDRYHYSEYRRDNRSRSPSHSRTDSHSHSSPDPHTRPPQRPLVVVNEPYKDLVKCHPTLTIMTYNVLASKLLQSNRYLYRNDNAEILEWDYRKGRLLQELIDSDAEIICLQEVQEEHYNNWYQPQLRAYRYQAIYQKRTGNHVDGSAIFFREESLQLVEHTAVLYQKYTGTLDRDNVGIIGRFRFLSSDGCSDFCVATTHILYNPKAGEVKLAQMAYLLAKLHSIAVTEGGGLLPCILCGDFNSLPNSPFLRFLLEGWLDYSRLQATDVAGYNRNSDRKRVIPVPLLPVKLGIGQNCMYSDPVPGRAHSSCSTHNATPHPQNNTIDLTEDKPKEITENVESTGKDSKEPIESVTRSNESKDKVDGGKSFAQSKDSCIPVLTHPFNFDSSYPMPIQGTEGPTITTYHRHASETVDYLLYTPDVRHKPGFRLLTRWALPSRYTLLRLGPQPNEVLSSDHLYLMAKFQLIF